MDKPDHVVGRESDNLKMRLCHIRRFCPSRLPGPRRAFFCFHHLDMGSRQKKTACYEQAASTKGTFDVIFNITSPRSIVHVNPTTEEISAIWSELLTLESLAPVRLRGGIARARTALLSSVPAWMLPQFLDALQLRK